MGAPGTAVLVAAVAPREPAGNAVDAFIRPTNDDDDDVGHADADAIG